MSEKKVNYREISSLKYEEAAAELEKIVEQLEDGQLSLDDTLVIYERGQMLAKYCAGQLDQAELKIRTLTGNNLSGEEQQEE